MKRKLNLRNRNLKWWLQKSILVARHPAVFWRRLSYDTKRLVSDCLSRIGYYRYPYRIIFIAGMPMSGSSWMKNLLGRIPAYYTRYMPIPKEIEYRQGIVDSAFSLLPRYGYTLLKTHLDPTDENKDCISRNGVEKVLVTYRDLRDVAVSRYYRLVEFPKPRKAFDFVDYKLLGREKALDDSIKRVADEFVPWIRGWFETARNNPERCLFIKFEELKRDTKGMFLKVLNFYGINLPDRKVNKIIEAAKGRKDIRKNIAEAHLLPWAFSSTFRSGKIGGWRDELSQAQIERCKVLLGPTLIEMGYEKDSNW